MSNKDQIYLEKAFRVFREEGLRLTIDEVADRMGVTKKTLYNHFGSKDELVSAVLRFFIDDLTSRLSIMKSSEVNAVEGFVRGVQEFVVYFQSLCATFLKEMQKFYPEAWDLGDSSGFGLLSESMAANYEKGIGEGLYQDDLNSRLIGQYFIFSMIEFLHVKVVNSNEYNIREYFRDIVVYHLRGISSSKGREVLAGLMQREAAHPKGGILY
ncbi:MAG: TetR/AcrR family transcriptional regulator [Bacteroidota bacterium]